MSANAGAWFGFQKTDGLVSVVAGRDLKTPAFQVMGEELAGAFVVVGDEDALQIERHGR